MTKVVMVTLMRWDDHGSMVSQEDIDQDVADEVSGGKQQVACARAISSKMLNVVLVCLKRVGGGGKAYELDRT